MAVGTSYLLKEIECFGSFGVWCLIWVDNCVIKTGVKKVS